MSVQETRLREIADAIRAKEGSTEPIPANTFASRILALEMSRLPEGTHTINLQASNPEGGTVVGGGVASDGMTVTAKAEVADRYIYTEWQENKETVSVDLQYTFPVRRSRNLVAVFSMPQYESGKDWWEVAIPSPATGAWNNIAYGGGKFVAVASKSKDAAYSLDGINWNMTTMPRSDNWKSVTYGNGRFVAVAGNSTYAAYSADGINWKATTLPGTYSWNSIAYGADKFVAVIGYASTSDVTSMAAYSTDGITWATVRFPCSGSWVDITYGNGRFIAISYSKTIVAYSDDGINWESKTLSFSDFASGLACAAYGNGRFVVIGTAVGAYAAYSSDGVNWIQTTFQNLYASKTGVTYGEGRFVAVTSSNKASYSTDGINWKYAQLPSVGEWRIAYGSGKFVAVDFKNNKAIYSCSTGSEA